MHVSLGFCGFPHPALVYRHHILPHRSFPLPEAAKQFKTTSSAVRHGRLQKAHGEASQKSATTTTTTTTQNAFQAHEESVKKELIFL